MGTCVSTTQREKEKEMFKPNFSIKPTNRISIKQAVNNKSSNNQLSNLPTDRSSINNTPLRRSRFITDMKQVKDLKPDDKVIILKDNLI